MMFVVIDHANSMIPKTKETLMEDSDVQVSVEPQMTRRILEGEPKRLNGLFRQSIITPITYT